MWPLSAGLRVIRRWRRSALRFRCVALVGIFVNLIVGLSVGPNAVLALLIGQNNREEINRTLHTVITFGAALGVGLMIVGWLTAKPILVLSGTPESVLDQALLYIFIYFLSIPFMLVYNFGSAVLRSYGDSRRPMYYLLISGTVNVILNLFLVIALQLGVTGVAIATVISNVLSAGMVLTHLARRNDDFAFRFRRMRIEKTPLLRILQIGIPAGIQGAIFSVSNVFIQSGINSFGENAIAGSSLALNFEYFTYDIANAFAQAAVTFTSQNYGAGDLRRCKKIFRYCMLFGVVFTEILSAVFMICDDFFVSIYTTAPSRRLPSAACGTSARSRASPPPTRSKARRSAAWASRSSLPSSPCSARSFSDSSGWQRFSVSCPRSRC